MQEESIVKTAKQYAIYVTKYDWGGEYERRPHGVIIKVRLNTNDRYFKVNKERIKVLQRVKLAEWETAGEYFPEYLYYQKIKSINLKLIKHIKV